MPKNIEWGDPDQPTEGGVVPPEPIEPGPKIRKRKTAARKRTRARRKTAQKA
jgi:hypothetical protein